MKVAICYETTKKGELVARRKLVSVFLLLCIMVLLLSPWADAPSPSSVPVAVQQGGAQTVQEPEEAEEISRITIEAALEEQEFRALSNMNDDFVFRHPDIQVELRRISPENAYETYRTASELEEAADVMLFRNEWVAEFASSGYLHPADAAFAGKALGEQFEALSAPLKWNGYLWGVPRDMDPYVLVWNAELLRAWLGEEAEFPLTGEQWAAAAFGAETEEANGAYWFAVDGQDPYALLAWLENYAQERTDGLWEQDGEPWEETARGQAMALLEEKRDRVRFGRDVREALSAGNALAGVLPYSEAEELVSREGSGEQAEFKLAIDHHSWNLPYIWPRGSSFVISSRTEAEEAAGVWIADMTGEQAQLLHMEEQGKLPVFRSLYDVDRRLSNLLPGRSGQAFPNQAPLLSGPDAVRELDRLGELWGEFSGGQLTWEEWQEAWESGTGD